AAQHVVPAQRAGGERLLLRGEVGGVVRVELGQICRDAVDDLGHDGRAVPQVRVVAAAAAGEPGDVEGDAAARRVGVDEPLHPGVVPGAVDDRVVRLRDGAGVLGRGLVGVGIGVGVGDDAGDAGVGAADLGGDAAPEVLGGDHLDHAGDARRAR